MVKVRLPGQVNHWFWQCESSEGVWDRGKVDGAEGSGGAQDVLGDADADRTVTVEWTGWGYDSDAAKVSAARGVANVIHDLRVRVQQLQRQQQSCPLDDNSNSAVANINEAETESWECPADLVSSKCHVLVHGDHLCRVWRMSNASFLVPGLYSRFGRDGIGTIHHESLPSMLTRYYEVPPSPSFVPPPIPIRTRQALSSPVNQPCQPFSTRSLTPRIVLLPLRNAELLRRRRTSDHPAHPN